MSPYSVIFCGTPAFAVPSLTALIADPRFAVNLVISQPDKPAGRKLLPAPSPVKAAAEKYGIPVCQPIDINEEWGRQSPPDFLVVVAYGQILGQPLLDLPRLAPVNLHASLLPRWRGASPIQHAILAGDRETGVTIQRMVRELDAGPILARATTPIAARETVRTLGDRLARMGADLLLRTLTRPLEEILQDAAEITACRKLTRADGAVSPRERTAEDIDRTVRALVPWPGVTCRIRDAEVKLLETALAETPGSIPIPCAESTILHVVSLQSPGRKPLTGKEWERGMR